MGWGEFYGAGEGDCAGDGGSGFAVVEMGDAEGDGLGSEGGGAGPAVEAREVWGGGAALPVEVQGALGGGCEVVRGGSCGGEVGSAGDALAGPARCGGAEERCDLGGIEAAEVCRDVGGDEVAVAGEVSAEVGGAGEEGGVEVVDGESAVVDVEVGGELMECHGAEGEGVGGDGEPEHGPGGLLLGAHAVHEGGEEGFGRGRAEEGGAEAGRVEGGEVELDLRDAGGIGVLRATERAGDDGGALDGGAGDVVESEVGVEGKCAGGESEGGLGEVEGVTEPGSLPAGFSEGEGAGEGNACVGGRWSPAAVGDEVPVGGSAGEAVGVVAGGEAEGVGEVAEALSGRGAGELNMVAGQGEGAVDAECRRGACGLDIG